MAKYIYYHKDPLEILYCLKSSTSIFLEYGDLISKDKLCHIHFLEKCVIFCNGFFIELV